MTEPERLGVVITGGGSGLGFSLASGFLEAGDRVVICGRDAAKLEGALRSLSERVQGGSVHAAVCDVSKAADLKDFSLFVQDRLGRVDRWINNAGSAGAYKRPLWELDVGDMQEVCATNLAGTMMASAEALRIMLAQPASPRPLYHIFNMGFSRAGAKFSRSSVPHRASKTSVASVTRFLSEEIRNNAITSVGVHELSPGLVKTPLLMQGNDPKTLRFLESVAEEPDHVARVLVPKIRAIGSRCGKVSYASFAGIAFRSMLAASDLFRSGWKP